MKTATPETLFCLRNCQAGGSLISTAIDAKATQNLADLKAKLGGPERGSMRRAIQFALEFAAKHAQGN